MSNRKLLLADDSITIQKVVNLTFAEEGIEVIAVGDGDAAMQKFTEVRPQIILADVNMPGISGYQLCERIKASEPATPVVLLVGSFEPFDENEAIRVGANAHITKPFQSIRQLVAKVNELIVEDDGVPMAAGPETDDIESLYQESISPPMETVESARFSDVGFDDDIIETSYAPPARIDVSTEFELVGEVPFLEVVETREPEINAGIQDQPVDAGSSETLETFPEIPAAEEQPAEPPAAFVGEETPLELKTAPYSQSGTKHEFEDIDLLELPTSQSGRSIEFTTPEKTRSTESTKRVVSFSPEVLETLASMVAEKISAQVTQEVARQAVAHITESIVRQTLEEDATQ